MRSVGSDHPTVVSVGRVHSRLVAEGVRTQGRVFRSGTLPVDGSVDGSDPLVRVTGPEDVWDGSRSGRPFRGSGSEVDGLTCSRRTSTLSGNPVGPDLERTAPVPYQGSRRSHTTLQGATPRPPSNVLDDQSRHVSLPTPPWTCRSSEPRPSRYVSGGRRRGVVLRVSVHVDRYDRDKGQGGTGGGTSQCLFEMSPPTRSPAPPRRFPRRPLVGLLPSSVPPRVSVETWVADSPSPSGGSGPPDFGTKDSWGVGLRCRPRGDFRRPQGEDSWYAPDFGGWDLSGTVREGSLGDRVLLAPCVTWTVRVLPLEGFRVPVGSSPTLSCLRSFPRSFHPRVGDGPVMSPVRRKGPPRLVASYSGLNGLTSPLCRFVGPTIKFCINVWGWGPRRTTLMCAPLRRATHRKCISQVVVFIKG